MTLEEFLVALEDTPRDWARWSYSLRNGLGGQFCPLTSVCVEKTSTWFQLQDFEDAGAALGLTPEISWEIAKAADKRGDSELRRRLLKACGLPEEPAP